MDDRRRAHRLVSPPASLWGNVVTVATLMVLFGTALLAPLIALAFLVVSILFPVVAFTTAALLVASVFLAKGPWPSLSKLGLFAHWRAFFALRVDVEQGPLPRRSIFGVFPHGVFPLGLFLASGLAEELFPERGDDPRVAGAVASAFFWAPLLAPVLTWLGCVPAAAERIRSLLRSDWSVMLLPEGIAGVFHTSWHHERVFLRSRKGFVRLALQEGAALVPVYVFGQSHLLSVLPGSGSFLERVSRRIQVSLSPFFGRFYLPLPRAIPLRVVVGAPLVLEPCAVPSEELVDAVHARFCQALQQLFDRHKADYGWTHRTLEVV